jgi:hypothetical protein
MRQTNLIPVLTLALLLAACATPAQRITTKLTEYGVPPPQAKCMGDRLASRLSHDQLRRLAEIASMNKDRVGRMSLNELAHQLNQQGDPKLVSEVLRAGLSCAI